MNSPSHSRVRKSLDVLRLRPIQSGLKAVLTIILFSAPVTAQDSVTFHEKSAARPLISSANFVNEANSLARANHWLQAVDMYLKALQLDKNDATAQNNLGHAYVALGRLDEATRCLEAAVKLQPDNAVFRYNLGNTYLALHQVPQAIDQLKEAVQLRDSYPDAHSDLGYAYLDNGEYKNALASFYRAVDINPNLAPAYSGLGLTYHQLGLFKEARSELLKGVARTQGSFDLQYNLGAVSLDLRDYSNAVRYFKTALNIAPNNSRALYCLGIAYLGLKDRNASITQYSKLRLLDTELASQLYKAINASRVLLVNEPK